MTLQDQGEDDPEDEESLAANMESALEYLASLVQDFNVDGDDRLKWDAVISAARDAVAHALCMEPPTVAVMSVAELVTYIVDWATLACTCPTLGRCWHQLLVAQPASQQPASSQPVAS